MTQICADIEEIASDYDNDYYEALTDILNTLIYDIKNMNKYIVLCIDRDDVIMEESQYYNNIFNSHSNGELIDYYGVEIYENVPESLDDNLIDDFRDKLKFNNYDIDLEECYKNNNWEHLRERCNTDIDELKRVVTEYMRLKVLQ